MKEAAVFILNWQGSNRITRKKKLGLITFDNFVGEYDHLIFAMMASESIKKDTLQKNYLAEMLVQVLEQDIELYLECLKRYEDFLNYPYITVQKICAETCRDAKNAGGLSKTEEEIEYAVWSAQIKTLYHLLEEIPRELCDQVQGCHRQAFAD